ncbi:MAG TPA: transcription termination factor NusA [Anaerolineales bacterium]|nr:transcription termination factor NusA [Anaerolineales bacterium]
MRSQTTLAFNEVVDTTKLNRDIIIEAIESALVTAYRRSENASSAQQVSAKFFPETGEVRVLAEKEVVDEVLDARTEVSLAEARRYAPACELGDLAMVDSTPPDFGRIAAQTAKQVILQRLREAEREDQYQEFAKREGEIVHGTIQSVTSKEITLSTGRSEAIMPRSHAMPGEKYRTHDKIRAFVVEVKRTPRGPQIIVSRKHRNMLRRLLEMEVPEIYNGVVEIKSIAREAGYRSKVAVFASQQGVDPVGACVGMRGVRIQSIVRELNDEKIDVIEWSADPSAFIQKALSPSRVSGVYLDDDIKNGRTATVIVPDDQLSLAIGREGQNARLAAKLTNWRIDIKSTTEAAKDAIEGIRARGDMAPLLEELGDKLAEAGATLVKKAEGKPIMPEEFTLLAKIADKYETRRLEQRVARRQAEQQRRREVRSGIAKLAFQTPIEFSGIPHVARKALDAAGFKTAGKVLEALRMDRARTIREIGLDAEILKAVEARFMEIRDPVLPTVPVNEDEEAPSEVEATPTPPTPTAEAVSAPVAPVTPETISTPVVDVVVEMEEETLPSDDDKPELGKHVYEAEPDEDEAIVEDVDFTAFVNTSPTLKDAELMQEKKKGAKKDKKKSAGTTHQMTYDEEAGRVVANKKRKANRRTDWLDEDEA